VRARNPRACAEMPPLLRITTPHPIPRRSPISPGHFRIASAAASRRDSSEWPPLSQLRAVHSNRSPPNHAHCRESPPPIRICHDRAVSQKGPGSAMIHSFEPGQHYFSDSDRTRPSIVENSSIFQSPLKGAIHTMTSLDCIRPRLNFCTYLSTRDNMCRLRVLASSIE
jgi:hypothetical protein